MTRDVLHVLMNHFIDRYVYFVSIASVNDSVDPFSVAITIWNVANRRTHREKKKMTTKSDVGNLQLGFFNGMKHLYLICESFYYFEHLKNVELLKMYECVIPIPRIIFDSFFFFFLWAHAHSKPKTLSKRCYYRFIFERIKQ